MPVARGVKAGRGGANGLVVKAARPEGILACRVWGEGTASKWTCEFQGVSIVAGACERV